MISPFKFRSDDPPLIDTMPGEPSSTPIPLTGDGFPIQLLMGPWGIDTNPIPPWRCGFGGTNDSIGGIGECIGAPTGIDTNPNPNPWNIDDVDFGVIHPPGIDGGGLGARGQDDNVDDLWKSGGTGSIDGEGFGMGVGGDGGNITGKSDSGGEFDIGEERTGIHGIGNENFDGITGYGGSDFIEPIDPGPIGPIMNVTEVMDMVNGGTNDG
ncbi:hypothetical protein LCGC14_1069330 [marine sediment metagenome]|uniref:Uncharacterized protein n=1 Tax=marine sediment metagenome TaxID=412755 RepID=A0A0F9Q1S8_9ZZZZ